MPAWRLNGMVVKVQKYDVASMDSESVPQFVGHVGLSNDGPKELGKDKEAPCLSMVHMMPPLRDNRHLWAIHAVGTANLSEGQVLQIKILCQRQQQEYEAQKVRGKAQYVIRPHVKAPDGEHPFHRYSCAGFVIEAYRWAGIELITLSDAALPKVSLATLKLAYRFYEKELDDPALRAEYGLEGAEPWPVVLAGHVMNALNRSASDVRRAPYQPSDGDEFFPRHRPKRPP
jgi:hypothetical protein